VRKPEGHQCVVKACIRNRLAGLLDDVWQSPSTFVLLKGGLNLSLESYCY
jgi:hypothetical protein